MKNICKIVLLFLTITGCNQPSPTYRYSSGESDSLQFPEEIVNFVPYDKNPVFTGSGNDTWDKMIRERGFILKEDGFYHMWYTGYQEGPNEVMHLGYATSPDGISWTRYENNPLLDTNWVEDMTVIKSGSIYYMFAEGRHDIAHMLTSADRVHWTEYGPLDIRYTTGARLSRGPYGTPSVWVEDNVWYLFYERDDLGIWLASSPDKKTWTNIQDEPVIKMGPEKYDQFAVAVDQVIKYKGKYYAYYHASEYKDWHEWTSCVAMSEDLIHWKKFGKNPIMRENKSSPVVVYDGERYRLYTMHPDICLHFPSQGAR